MRKNGKRPRTKLRSSPKEPVRYPWDAWFRRKELRLRRGEHYECPPYSIAQQVRNEASERGVRVRIRIEGASVLVTNLGKRSSPKEPV